MVLAVHLQDDSQQVRGEFAEHLVVIDPSAVADEFVEAGCSCSLRSLVHS